MQWQEIGKVVHLTGQAVAGSYKKAAGYGNHQRFYNHTEPGKAWQAPAGFC